MVGLEWHRGSIGRDILAITEATRSGPAVNTTVSRSRQTRLFLASVDFEFSLPEFRLPSKAKEEAKYLRIIGGGFGQRKREVERQWGRPECRNRDP